MAIVAKYSCVMCGVKEQEITVRTRRRNQDVVAYTNYVGSMAGRDHAIRSPRCPSKSCELYLPVGGTKDNPQIGAKLEGSVEEVAAAMKRAARAMNIPVDGALNGLPILEPTLTKRAP